MARVMYKKCAILLIMGMITVLSVFSVSAADDSDFGVFGDDNAALQGDADEFLAFDILLSGTLQHQHDMLEDQRSHRLFYDIENAVLDYRSGGFSLFADIALNNDERYDPSEAYMLGRYIYTNDAYVSFRGDRFSVKSGRTIQSDTVESPYSLFVSSEAIPAVQIETKYLGDTAFYTNRWVRLNYRSEQIYYGSKENSPYWDAQLHEDCDPVYPYREDYPNGVHWLDRGANFHVYGLNLGEWRFGLQESAVFYSDSFNAESFFSPMVMYLSQLIVNGGAKPWNEFSNSKHFMGFFADKTTDDSYFASQILIDDINGDILPGVDNDNQNLLAWSVGGYKQFDFGKIGFYHGGATKDTFSPTYASYSNKTYDSYKEDQVPVYYSTRPYPYTYYPAVQYQLEDGTAMPIDYTQNYIGYKYGENALSFLLDYENTFSPDSPRELTLYASLEWVLNGAKSPINPWHEYVEWENIPDATQLLDGTVEHIVTLRSSIERGVRLFGEPFSLFADAEAGVMFNRMGLEPATEETALTEAWIYRPQKGEHEPFFRVTAGLKYQWRIK